MNNPYIYSRKSQNDKKKLFCPNCANEVHIGEIFCENSCMSIHDNIWNIETAKTNLSITYIFYREKDYINEKEIICYKNHTICNKINWHDDLVYTNGHDHACTTDLYDDLTQEELKRIVRRIREHSSQYYQH